MTPKKLSTPDAQLQSFAARLAARAVAIFADEQAAYVAFLMRDAVTIVSSDELNYRAKRTGELMHRRIRARLDKLYDRTVVENELQQAKANRAS